MDAWDDGEKVRPIPVTGEPTGPDGEPEADDEVVAAPRPWLPIAIAAFAIVAVIGSVSVFGALRFDEPPPPADDEFSSIDIGEEGSTTTSTLPPTLEEMLPGVTDRLTLIAERDDELWALLWDPSFREPKAVSLEVTTTDTGASFSEARFDRGGRNLAVAACTEDRCRIYVGSPTDVGSEPDIVGAWDFAWHASEVGRAAWVAATETGYEVRVGSVDPLDNTLREVVTAFSLEEPARIVQWDGTGMVLGFPGPDHRTIAYTESGEELWTLPGSASSGTRSMVAIESEGGWSLVDRSTGESIAPSLGEETLVTVTTSEAADLIAELAERAAGSFSLTVTGGSLRAPRSITIEQAYEPLGFTDNSVYFLFEASERTTIFVDWHRGSARPVSAPEGYRVIGLDVG